MLRTDLGACGSLNRFRLAAGIWDFDSRGYNTVSKHQQTGNVIPCSLMLLFQKIAILWGMLESGFDRRNSPDGLATLSGRNFQIDGRNFLTEFLEFKEIP